MSFYIVCVSFNKSHFTLICKDEKKYGPDSNIRCVSLQLVTPFIVTSFTLPLSYHIFYTTFVAFHLVTSFTLLSSCCIFYVAFVVLHRYMFYVTFVTFHFVISFPWLSSCYIFHIAFVVSHRYIFCHVSSLHILYIVSVVLCFVTSLTLHSLLRSCIFSRASSSYIFYRFLLLNLIPLLSYCRIFHVAFVALRLTTSYKLLLLHFIWLHILCRFLLPILSFTLLLSLYVLFHLLRCCLFGAFVSKHSSCVILGDGKTM